MLYDTKWAKEVVVDEVAEILLKAADYMEEHGWRTFGRKAQNGAVCLVGAIAAIVYGDAGVKIDNGIDPYSHPATKRVKLLTGDISPADWNDCRCRSGAEAVAMLRRAAYLK